MDGADVFRLLCAGGCRHRLECVRVDDSDAQYPFCLRSWALATFDHCPLLHPEKTRDFPVNLSGVAD